MLPSGKEGDPAATATFAWSRSRVEERKGRARRCVRRARPSWIRGSLFPAGGGVSAAELDDEQTDEGDRHHDEIDIEKGHCRLRETLRVSREHNASKV